MNRTLLAQKKTRGLDSNTVYLDDRALVHQSRGFYLFLLAFLRGWDDEYQTLTMLLCLGRVDQEIVESVSYTHLTLPTSG